MPRSLVLGNGSMLATFDEHMQMRDFYYPYVGLEDHTTYGNVHKVGFLVEGKGFSWLDDGSWKIEPGYMNDALVGNSKLINQRLQLEVIAEDFVDPLKTILMRSFKLRSMDGVDRRAQCFFHHDFHIYGAKQKDTAFYEPHTKSVIHYQLSRYFLIGGTTSDPVTCVPSEPLSEFHPMYDNADHIDHCGLISFAIGKSKYKGLEGTFRDAEDGILSRLPIDQGSVDSTVEIDCLVHADRPTSLYIWVCVGENINQVHDLQHYILEETPEQVKQSTINYWHGWVRAHEQAKDIPSDLNDLYHRSLLIVRTQIDNHGGILAANDNDIMQFNRDSYTYVWPRDGAFVSMALIRAGQNEAARRFFEFCARVQTEEGYLLHKYNPDGSFGSSWHPWYNGGLLQLPIQCDETALPITALWQYFLRFQDFEFLHDLYQKFVKKAADFLMSYTDPKTGLPLPSYDLWEEKRGIFSFTTAATIAGLRDAANISHALGHYRHAAKYQDAADHMKQAFLTHLYDEETKSFLKKVQFDEGKVIERDTTADASLALIWMLDVLPPTDPRIVNTMQRLKNHLTIRTPVGGLARYSRDPYHAVVKGTEDVPGNPWIITTLWYAVWQIEMAGNVEDMKAPLEALQWAKKWTTPSGIMAEQLDPYSGKHLSVSPLTWSHSVYIDTFLRYTEKMKKLKGEK